MNSNELKPSFAYLVALPLVAWFFFVLITSFMLALFFVLPSQDPEAAGSVFTLQFFSILAIFFLVIFSAVVYWFKKYWETYSIELTNDNIVIKHGVVTKSISIFSYTEIQQVDVQRNLFSHLLGVADVNVYTMSFESTTEGVIRGLPLEQAEWLRNFLSTRKNKGKTVKKAAKTTSVKALEVPLTVAKLELQKYFLKSLALAIFCLVVLALLFLVVTFIGGWLVALGVFSLFLVFVFVIGIAFLADLFRIATLKFQVFKTQAFLSYWLGLSSAQATMPFSSIQDVSVSQGPFEKLFGLSTLTIQTGRRVVYTSSEDGRQQTITNVPALSLTEANRLKNELLKRMH